MFIGTFLRAMTVVLRSCPGTIVSVTFAALAGASAMVALNIAPWPPIYDMILVIMLAGTLRGTIVTLLWWVTALVTWCLDMVATPVVMMGTARLALLGEARLMLRCDDSDERPGTRKILLQARLQLGMALPRNCIL